MLALNIPRNKKLSRAFSVIKRDTPEVVLQKNQLENKVK